MVLEAFGIGGCIVGATVGVPIGYLMRHIRHPCRRRAYLGLMGASIGPYILHYRGSLSFLWVSGVDRYPGLDQYTAYFPLTVLVLTASAIFIGWFRPALGALLPIVLGSIYWFFLVPLLYVGVPDSFVGLDNVPFIWLFAYSLSACAMFLAIVLIALRPDAAAR